METKYYSCAAVRPRYHLYCTREDCSSSKGEACPNDSCYTNFQWQGEAGLEFRDCEFHKTQAQVVEQAIEADVQRFHQSLIQAEVAGAPKLLQICKKTET